MAKLKLGSIEDDKPVRVTVDLPAQVHRDLVAYGELLGAQAGHASIEPARLIGPMLLRFMATDRAFLKARRSRILAPNLHTPSAESPVMRRSSEAN